MVGVFVGTRDGAGFGDRLFSGDRLLGVVTTRFQNRSVVGRSGTPDGVGVGDSLHNELIDRFEKVEGSKVGDTFTVLRIWLEIQCLCGLDCNLDGFRAGEHVIVVRVGASGLCLRSVIEHAGKLDRLVVDD